MKKAIYICKIWQTGNHCFSILWNDGQTQNFRLSNIQRMCPCARCIDETTGQRILDLSTVDENVRAVKLRNVGRYGMQIQFTSGCSTGIYSFELLRGIK